MAKWDLSKLPEGRKPLPDEWFAERAQMQDRIKELEKQLRWVLYERDATFKSMLNRAETAEANLAKAEWLLVDATVQLEEGKIKTRRNRAALIRQFLAELTGGKDE